LGRRERGATKKRVRSRAFLCHGGKGGIPRVPDRSGRKERNKGGHYIPSQKETREKEKRKEFSQKKGRPKRVKKNEGRPCDTRARKRKKKQRKIGVGEPGVGGKKQGPSYLQALKETKKKGQKENQNKAWMTPKRALEPNRNNAVW